MLPRWKDSIHLTSWMECQVSQRQAQADQPMMGGDSLDGIVQAKQSELHRLRSMPQEFGDPMALTKAFAGCRPRVPAIS